MPPLVIKKPKVLSAKLLPATATTIPHYNHTTNRMSRGNQRENARAKAAKKAAGEKGKLPDAKKRLEEQAEIMRKKQAAADAKRAGA